ncbi:MAG: asparagine synthase (glutamine-hydrolyzing) [Flavobacteriales bacterium]|nr:asparagine synthase (glutamine-hydrolyzing) [Flavobacteriales bacterium]
MCGIAGSYQFGSGPVQSEDRISDALRCLAHRGPDDEGVHRSGRTVLGHRRLSVIDTSPAAHQPFTDEGGRFTIAFNGEAFNYQELRAELEAHGHRFRSQSDTEVVLRLFALKGEGFLHDLNGFFALAIHDAVKDELLIARDRFGEKPLWYCEQDGRLLFASELRALEALGAKGELDPHSLHQYFTFHYIPAPWSVLKGARKLKPGELIRVSARGVERSRWYDVVGAAKRTRTSSDPRGRLRELLDESVRLRLNSDVPIGAFLSGGLDSSIVSALAARHRTGLRTFSIGYADAPYFDETRFAEEAARHIGTDHTSIRLSTDDLAAGYTDFLACVDEPFADSSALPAFILAREARKHVTVALSGDGADELFGGYRKHQAQLRLAEPQGPDKAVIALGPLWRLLPKSRNNRISDSFRKLDRFAKNAGGSAEQLWLDLAGQDPDDDAGRLVPQPGSPLALRERESQLSRGVKSLHGFNGYLLADLETVLPNDMLHKVDLTSMAHGLEVRAPFLDHRVVEIAFSMPAEMKLRRGAGKAILREAFGAMLPPSIVARRKQGFEVPLRDLLLGPLPGLQEELLREELVHAAGLDPRGAAAVRRRLRSSFPGDAQATVHALLVYMTWWKARRSRASAA